MPLPRPIEPVDGVVTVVEGSFATKKHSWFAVPLNSTASG